MATTHDAVPDDRNAGVLIYINGDLVERADAKISVFDSGFLVGDGVWEGIRLHRGEFAFLDDHLDRLFGAARATDLESAMAAAGYDRAGIVDALESTVAANAMSDAVHLRLMVTRGDKKTPSQHPANTVGPPNVVIIAEHKIARTDVADRGIALFTATVRRPPPDTLDQRLNCHSKLHEVLALIQATNAGADEALMLDTSGSVATCNATNFFCVRGGELWTSNALHNLPGITRAKVIDVAQANGVVVHAAPFSLTDVYAADEAFVTGTFGGLTPAHTIDGRTIGDGTRPMMDRLRVWYAEAIDADVAARARRRAERSPT